jgi:hypothetical protein
MGGEPGRGQRERSPADHRGKDFCLVFRLCSSRLPPHGAALGHLARSAFSSGMSLGLTTGACVAAAGCLIALLALPSRAAEEARALTGQDESEQSCR